MVDKASSMGGGDDLWRTVQQLLELQRQAPPLSVAPPNEFIPASFQQERLWLMQAGCPATTAYHLPTVLQLEGRLNLDVLDRSLCAIVRRHEVLRTTLRMRAGRLEQVTAPPPSSLLVVRDFSSRSASEQEERIKAYTVETIRRPFDLAQDWPFRAALVRLAFEVHRLILVFHHIAFDAWSESIFFRELAAIYEALCKGGTEPLAPLALQYRDFAYWQRQWLTPAVLDPLRAYWKEALQPTPEPMHWPSDGLEGYDRRGPTEQVTVVESAPFHAAFTAWARQEGATPFVALLAAFLATLRSFTGTDRPYLCSPVAGRTRPEVGGLIGYFVNLVPLVGPPAHGRTFREYLAAVQRMATGALAHQDLPFHLLVADLPGLPSSLARIMFSHRNAPLERPSLAGLVVSARETDGLVDVDADVFLSSEESKEGLRLSLQYNAAALRRKEAECLLQALRDILRDAMENPDLRLKEVPVEYRVDMSGQSASSMAHEDTGQGVPPADELECALAGIWARVLNRPHIGVTDDFFLLGGRSLLAMRMLAEVKKELGYQAEPAMVAQARTVRAFARMLRKEQVRRGEQSPLTCLQGKGQGPPVFLVPPAAATPLQFVALAQRLAPNYPVYGLEYPGMDGRCAPFSTVEALAQHYIEAIRGIWPQGPYFLGGRCFGGIVAYEMARQLTEAGEKVGGCVILDTLKPPGAELPFWDDLVGRIMDARLIPNWERLPAWRKVLWIPPMSIRKLWRVLARTFGATDSAIPAEQASHVRRVHVACEKARRVYRPATPWPGHLDVACCVRRPLLQRLQEGWKEYAATTMFHRCSGAHISLLDEPYVAEVAQIFRERLAAMGGRSSGS